MERSRKNGRGKRERLFIENKQRLEERERQNKKKEEGRRRSEKEITQKKIKAD